MILSEHQYGEHQNINMEKIYLTSHVFAVALFVFMASLHKTQPYWRSNCV